MNHRRRRDVLERLYDKYNRRTYVHPDPLELLYAYDDVRDREIAGLIAASLAYGRVERILKSAADVLRPMGPSPFRWLSSVRDRELKRTFKGFRHRFAGDENLIRLLSGIKRIILSHGSLCAAFMEGLDDADETLLPALSAFAEKLTGAACAAPEHLTPHPGRGSACKRLNLFLRWMARRDRVDPGGWPDVPAAKLIVPLDVHMHRICRMMGLTGSRRADMKTALEITAAFREISPEDPVKYDFALTRLGIRDDLSILEAVARIEAAA